VSSKKQGLKTTNSDCSAQVSLKLKENLTLIFVAGNGNFRVNPFSQQRTKLLKTESHQILIITELATCWQVVSTFVCHLYMLPSDRLQVVGFSRIVRNAYKYDRIKGNYGNIVQH